MDIEGVLFDKDGTLTDFHATWMPAYRQAAQAVAARAGKPAMASELLGTGGYDEASGRCDPASPLACGSNREIADLWSLTSGVPAAEVDDELARMFKAHAAARPVAAADLHALLGGLRSRGLLLGIATMDSEALAHETVRVLGIGDYFDFICGYDSGFGHKPDVGMVRAFCASTGLSAARIAVVGDTPHDLKMARAAGVGLVIGVLTGASPADWLAGLADHVLSSVGELPALLGER